MSLRGQLDALKKKGRYRALSPSKGLDLSSNDYLGMRDHPHLRRAALDALEGGMPLGAGGSRLLRGNDDAHRALEDFAANYYGHESALFFASGYQAGQTLFASLPSRHDLILFDSLIHACARDGIQTSPAKHKRIAHNDLNAYEDALKTARMKTDGINVHDIWIAVESVYSMDGDRAPLPDLYALARRYDAYLVVDEAHASGIFGQSGKGFCADLPDKSGLIVMHTCGKAYGVSGGIICGENTVIESLINRGRGFIYSTAPMPLQAHLVQKSMEILSAEPQRRELLLSLIDKAKTLLPDHYTGSQIIPVIIGEDGAAVTAAKALQARGYDIRAVRPPTVPEGAARLRLSLNTSLDEKILKSFASDLADVL